MLIFNMIHQKLNMSTTETTGWNMSIFNDILHCNLEKKKGLRYS